MRVAGGAASEPLPAAMPAKSLVAVLGPLRGLFPAELLDDPSWGRLMDRLGVLPASFARFTSLEFRLGDPARSADASFPLMPGTLPAEDYLASEEAAVAGSVAAELSRCVVRIGRKGSSLGRWLRGMYMEYDIVDVEPGEHPPPGVYLSLRADGVSHARAGIAPTLARIAGRPPQRWERRAVEHAYDALPAGGRIVRAGSFSGREQRAIRFVAAGLGADAVPGFLERLGWRGPGRAVASALSETGEFCAPERVGFLFDLTADGALPALGMELFVAQRGELYSSSSRKWQPLIEQLVRDGRCLPEKARVLREWPGHDRHFTGRGMVFVHRWINHVKLTVREDAMDAKAYIGLTRAPLRDLATAVGARWTC